MNEDLILTLQNYGFSEKEAKIYLTALSLGAAPASSIARNANESRTTVYSVLGDLVKKGYCSSVVRENVTYFSAVSPEMLVKIQEQKYQKIKEKLPEFNAIRNMLGLHTKVKTYEGNNAMKNLFLELSTTEVDPKFFQGAFDIKGNIIEFPKDELNYYIDERIRKGLTTYRILSSTNRVNQKTESEKDKKKKYKRETLVVDDLDINSEMSIYIYGPDKVAFFIMEGNYPNVLIMQNKYLYKYINSIFDYIRKTHKKLK